MSHLHVRPAMAALLFASQIVAIEGCVKDSESVHCARGFWCPKGMKCGADGKTCLPTTCGNGSIEGSEECDPGVDRQTAQCNVDCTKPRCGDNLVNEAADEECDPGPGARETKGCNYNCRFSKCGDGIVNLADEEECDSDGGESITCNADCTLLRCGDGATNRTGGEECDSDGGESITCNADCTLLRCGDGKTNRTGGEECDDGAESTICNANCTLLRCGDGVTNRTGGEECDDGAESTTCNADCTLLRCGDGKTNRTGGEECDDGARNSDTGACLKSCRSARCGDAIIQGSEQCDPGPQGQTAQCNGNCTWALCGDGVVNSVAGEACDPGLGVRETEVCNFDCTLSRCGDGIVNLAAEEKCDDGAGNNGTTACPYGTPTCSLCSADCKTLMSRTGSWCGDGHVNGPAEACDNAMSFACGTCTTSCRPRGPSRAEGAITVRFLPVTAGDTFSVNDGTFEEVFELVGSSPAAEGHVPIVVPTPGSHELLAESIADAIRARCGQADGGLALSVRLDGSVIALTNSRPGVNGNQPLGSTRATAVVLEGMSGGVGCTIGELCESDMDCAEGHCTYHVCRDAGANPGLSASP